jgi:hypothetical protein
METTKISPYRVLGLVEDVEFIIVYDQWKDLTRSSKKCENLEEVESAF